MDAMQNPYESLPDEVPAKVCPGYKYKDDNSFSCAIHELQHRSPYSR
jgi:hypothetical protein